MSDNFDDLHEPDSRSDTSAPPAIRVKPQELKLESNPYKKWIYLAHAIDSWRIFPRIFLLVYVILLYKTVTWFMGLPDPDMEQAGLISVIVGAGAAWFGLYINGAPRISKE
jgi:hypothetical protein